MLKKISQNYDSVQSKRVIFFLISGMTFLQNQLVSQSKD